MTTTLIKWMLFYNRRYVVEKIKKPLMEAVIKFAECGSWLSMLIALIQIIRTVKKYPEPTRQNTVFRNTRIRLDVQDKILGNLRARRPLIKAGFRVLNAECEHDGFYEFIHDIYIVELLIRGWEPDKQHGFPMWRYWKGQLPEEYCIETNPKWLDKRRERFMYADIVAAIDNLKELVVGQGEQFDGISDRLDNVEKQLKLLRIGHEQHDWGKEVSEKDLDIIEVEE